MGAEQQEFKDLMTEFTINSFALFEDRVNIDFKEVAKALDQFLTDNPDTKYLVLGENHRYKGINLEMMANPNIISTLHKHELTTTALEKPAAIQPFYDTAKNEGQTLDEFAKAIHDECTESGLEISLNGLKSAFEPYMPLMQADNNVIYYDNPDYPLSMLSKRDETVERANLYNTSAQRGAIKVFNRETTQQDMAELHEKGLISSQQDIVRYKAMIVGNALSEEGTNPHRKHEKFLELRVNEKDEGLRAQHIKDNTVQGAVVIAGHAHGFGHGDLDEQLGAKRLYIAKDMDDYIRCSQMDYSAGNEAPEGYLILSEAKIISGADAYAAAQKFETDTQNAINGEKAPTIEKTAESAPHIAEPC